jgi:hypothetical protein
MQRLQATLVFAIALPMFVIGDSITTCESGESCEAWKALFDGSLKTSVKEHVNGHDAQYYRIEVDPGNGEKPWSVFRRYSDVDSMRERLGDGVVDLRYITAPFPPKLYANWFYETFAPEKFEERRKQLDVWLQQVTKHPDCKGKWADEMFKFLDPKSVKSIKTSGIDMPPDANRICGGKHHYLGIDVASGEATARVWRRYSEFADLEKKITSRCDHPGCAINAPFPPKLIWNSFIKIFEGHLQERRRGLLAWLQELKVHPYSNDDGLWAEELKTFLDPEANQEKLKVDCAWEEKVADLTAWYNKAKDKLVETVEAMTKTDEATTRKDEM